jgi:hypothetical protein
MYSSVNVNTILFLKSKKCIPVEKITGQKRTLIWVSGTRVKIAQKENTHFYFLASSMSMFQKVAILCNMLVSRHEC